MEGEDSEEGTRKFAGRVSAEPAAKPRTSFGLNFFLQEGALLKLLSSSWDIEGQRPNNHAVKDEKAQSGYQPFTLMAELMVPFSVTCL